MTRVPMGSAPSWTLIGLFVVAMVFCISPRGRAEAAQGSKDATETQAEIRNDQPCGPTPVETCGATALSDFASLYEIVIPQEWLQEIATAQQGRPMSLLQLRDELRALGLQTEGYRADGLGDIAALDRPAIAIVTVNGQGHFVVIETVADEWVRMLEAGEVVIATRENVADVFSGYVLVREDSDDRQGRISQSALSVEPSIAEAKPQETVTVVIRNVGTTARLIKDVAAPAGYTVLAPEAYREQCLMPGEQLAILLGPTGDLAALDRPHDCDTGLMLMPVVVHSDDPVRLSTAL